jgi:hypothetical protein
VTTVSPVRTTRSDRHRLRLDPFDVGALIAFSILSIWFMAVLISQSGPNRIWTGTDGPFIGDQMQFIGWIAEASHHLLVSNPFQSTTSEGVFLHPGVAASGLLVRLGLRPSVSFLLWKPIAVITLFGATRAYVRRLLTKTAHRRAALVLALFYISPVSWIVMHFVSLNVGDRLGLQGVTIEMWPGNYLWGYPFTALAVALMPLTLLVYERDRRAHRVGPWAPVCGLLCAWFQPWQGATLLVVIGVTEMLLWWREKRIQPVLLAVNAAAIVVPLGYYALLSRISTAWAQSGRVNLIVFPALLLVMVIAPLGIVALFAYRLPALTFHEVALRVWPIAALGEYGLISLTHVGTFPSHSLQGLGIPLAILAVLGATSLRLSVKPLVGLCVGTGIVVLLLVPSLANELNGARAIGKSSLLGGSEPYLITSSENSALEYLRRDPVAGSVLAPVYLGQTVPAETGRRTWVGIKSWTPDYQLRIRLASELFSGQLTRAEALDLLQASKVTFLLSDCSGHDFGLARFLGSAIRSVQRFGCATVYTVGAGDGR